jgi:O-antigen/teichoic acid export membrane protein
MTRRLTLLLLIPIILSVFVSPATAKEESISVYYAGEVDSSVLRALELAGFALVDVPAQADVLLLNGAIPDAQVLAAQVESGKGLVLILGEATSAEDIETLLGFPVTLEQKDEAASLVEIKVDDPLTTEILWNGAPQVRERFVTVSPVSSVQPLVATYEDGEWVLWQVRPTVFVINAVLENDTTNAQLQQWAYYNYWIYHLVNRAAGETPLSFSDYPGSPVPHAAERNALWLILGLLTVTTFGIFLVVRRYSLRHPEALDQIVVDRRAFETLEGQTDWEDVGFHRPLAGFLVALSIGLILFIPLIIYQNLILPVYILPSAQALGIWGRVVQFFSFAWLFFDMGTSIAFIKFLSQYRVNDPKRGIQYGQVFFWWQALSGAIQVALVVGIATTWAPKSAYALYAWSVIIHAFIQLPGFFQVMRHALNGFQRQDYARYLDMGLNLIFPMLIQPVFVGLAFLWGKANPQFGGAMGGLLGLGVAAYASELLTFLLGLWLYRRVGYNPKVLFLAHFDWEIIKTSFKFGVFEMLGSLAWAAGQAVEIGITQARLINYAEIWGNWGLAQNFIFAFNVTQTINDGTMPAISEAISHGKKILSQYYSVMLYKWNGLGSFFIGAVLLAVADRFILGASGPEFVRAARYVIPLAIWGAFQYPSWVGDNVQLGSNRPYLKSLLVFSEQVVRVVLALILLERFQINALIIAYFVGLFAKGITAYFVNHKLCYPQRFYFWQSLFAPLLAAGIHFALLRWLTGLIWQGDQITSVLIFFIGILPSFPVYMFFYGLAGGWDTDTLDELHQAVALTGFMRPAVWLIWKATDLGVRLSPLHNRFPISIRPAAMLEARELTAAKVDL